MFDSPPFPCCNLEGIMRRENHDFKGGRNPSVVEKERKENYKKTILFENIYKLFKVRKKRREFSDYTFWQFVGPFPAEAKK